MEFILHDIVFFNFLVELIPVKKQSNMNKTGVVYELRIDCLFV